MHIFRLFVICNSRNIKHLDASFAIISLGDYLIEEFQIKSLKWMLNTKYKRNTGTTAHNYSTAPHKKKSDILVITANKGYFHSFYAIFYVNTIQKKKKKKILCDA